MATLRNYDTVTEAMKDLVKRGYITDFELHAEQGLVNKYKNISLSPDEFEIDETYRFEGNTDPGDEMIVFAISSKKHNIKGTIVNGYGIYANAYTSNIVAHLKKHIPK